MLAQFDRGTHGTAPSIENQLPRATEYADRTRSRSIPPAHIRGGTADSVTYRATSATGDPPGHHRFEGTPSQGLGIDGNDGSGCMTTVVA